MEEALVLMLEQEALLSSCPPNLEDSYKIQVLNGSVETAEEIQHRDNLVVSNFVQNVVKIKMKDEQQRRLAHKKRLYLKKIFKENNGKLKQIDQKVAQKNPNVNTGSNVNYAVKIKTLDQILNKEKIDMKTSPGSCVELEEQSSEEIDIFSILNKYRSIL